MQFAVNVAEEVAAEFLAGFKNIILEHVSEVLIFENAKKLVYQPVPKRRF